MASLMFLKITEVGGGNNAVIGEAIHADHAQQIEVYSWGWSIKKLKEADAFKGPDGKQHYGDVQKFKFEKPLDRASTRLRRPATPTR